MQNLFEVLTSSFFGFFCHQDASVLFEINEKTLMLCPRCCGLHIGFLFFLIWFLTIKKVGNISGIALKLFAFSGIIIMLSEWLLANYGITHSTFSSRLVTGLLAGISASILVTGYRTKFVQTPTKIVFPRKIILIPAGFILAASLVLYLADKWLAATLFLTGIVAINLILFGNTMLLRLFFSKKTSNQKKLCYEKIN